MCIVNFLSNLDDTQLHPRDNSRLKLHLVQYATVHSITNRGTGVTGTRRRCHWQHHIKIEPHFQDRCSNEESSSQEYKANNLWKKKTSALQVHYPKIKLDKVGMVNDSSTAVVHLLWSTIKNTSKTSRTDDFCPLHCFRTQKSRHLCAEKGEIKKESNVSILYLPVSLYSCKSLDVPCKSFVEYGWYWEKGCFLSSPLL